MSVEVPAPLAAAVADSHCHLDITDYERADHAPEDCAEALAAAAGVNVTRIVQIGVDVASSEWSARVAEQYENVVAAVALHPNEAPRIFTDEGREGLEAAWARIESASTGSRVRAIGETGLDYYRTEPELRAVQQESFAWHIDLAKRTGKTLVIHDREAHDDVISVLDEVGAPEKVVFHCFSGDAQMARLCADRGWFLSFAGVVTFKNAQGLRDALAVTPDELVLVETDAPFLTPAPNRGKPNASFLMPYTVREMARVRNVDESTMATTLLENTFAAFGDW